LVGLGKMSRFASRNSIIEPSAEALCNRRSVRASSLTFVQPVQKRRTDR
jgi:hypothetical protein